MKSILLVLIISILSAGCGKTSNTDKPSVKISGTFSGIIPCADCEGILYQLNLNTDSTYADKMTYAGKNVPPFENSGKWAFTDSNRIKLTGKTGPTGQLFISKGNLIILDPDGKMFDGPMADKFILKPGLTKLPESGMTDSSKYPSTTGTSSSTMNSINGAWTLTEINGKKADKQNYTNGLPEIDIREADNKFSGSTGCNRINGASTIVGNEIIFTKYITTKMACPGNGENDFIAALALVKTYTIDKNKLMLIAEGKTLLEFTR